MTNTTIEIISLLKTKFNPTEAQQFANLIDERIREVAFELIKKNLDASSSNDPYLGLRWNGTGLNSAKFELNIRFKTVEAAHVFAFDYDCECRDHAEDWVDVWLDKKSDLNKFVKIVMNDPDVEHFSVSKF